MASKWDFLKIIKLIVLDNSKILKNEVIWTRVQILYEFVAAGIGVIKTAEKSQNFPLVCRCQYSSEFFATSIGQVCRCRYVPIAQSFTIANLLTIYVVNLHIGHGK